MLDQCLDLAQKIAANRPRCSDIYTGAASASAVYDPYTAEWKVWVDWSCSTKVEYSGVTADRACEKVIKDLRIILRDLT